MDANRDKFRVILITDGELSLEGYGIRRTLFNVFKGLSLEVLCPAISETKELPFSHAYYTAPKLPKFLKRFGRIAQRIIEIIELSLFSRLNLVSSKKVEGDIIVVSSNLMSTFIAAKKLIETLKLPYVVYLMDETEELERVWWFGGNGRDLLRSLFMEASGWISVSDELKNLVSKRLGIAPKRSLILHNPVAIKEPSPPSLRNVFTVGYAGSIWDMQKDPLVAVSKAIHKLRSKGEQIELILHTPSYFWEKDKKSIWEPLEIRFGGEIPYDSLHETLGKTCDLLLATASFLKRYSSYTSSSLQTKLTDYMASGVPILCVAPEESVIAKFVKKWRCGFIEGSSDVDSISESLLKIKKSKSEMFEAGKNGYNAAKDHFSITKAKQEVENLLRECL